MKTKIYSLVLIALISASTVLAQDSTDKRPPVEKWTLEKMEETVAGINKETREITLEGDFGDTVTITASDDIKRFDEIEVGDVIVFESWTYMLAEFRRPTPEELAEPLVVLAEGGKAPEGMPPGAVVGAVMRAVVTIEILNHPMMEVTVRGPQGNYTTLPMENEGLMEQLNINEVVIMTYAEAVAVSLEKKVVAPAEPTKKKKKK